MENRRWLSLVQAWRKRSACAALVEDVGTNCCNVVVEDAHDSVHLACTQCSTDSCRRAVEICSLV